MSRHSASIASRSLAALLACFAGIVGLTLSAIHPISPIMAVAAFTTVAVASMMRPAIVPFVVPALLPVLALAPWSGWIIFEELDLLVLAVAAGACSHRSVMPGRRSQKNSPVTRFLVALFAASLLVAAWRGFDDAGGLVFGVFQSYYDPLNSLRLSKGFLLALLLVPTYKLALQEHPELAGRRLVAGFVTGLAGAALAVIWERTTYTSLLDFSSDYRATGSFWEMHVGGATLDGYLALCFPLALWAAISTRSVIVQLIAALVVALAGYACFATFSRGVYLAIPVSLLGLAFAAWRNRSSAHVANKASSFPTNQLGLALGFAVAAYAAFSGAGYRGLSALAICAGLVLALGALARNSKLPWIAIGISAALASAGLIAAAFFVPKGPYAAFLIASGVSAVTLWRAFRYRAANKAFFASAATFTSLVLAVSIGEHWGNESGLLGMAVAASVIAALLAWQLTAREPVWPEDQRSLVNLGLGAFVLATAVSVFGGGAYMSGRFSTSSQDMSGRLGHWRLGADLLKTPDDWALGKGLGRFPASYLYALPDGEFPGGYHLIEDAGESYLTLTGSRRPIGFGSILRVSQRLDYSPATSHVFTADVRADHPVALHVEICEKHLLYTDRCASKEQWIKPAIDRDWQKISVLLDTGGLSAGSWFAPRHVVFSIGVESTSGKMDIDNLRLAPSNSPNLLANPDFSGQMARWFFSSDRVHMPWHIKSLYANVLFDQGLIGLALFTALVGRALWRLTFGHARGHPLAPPLFAGLIGFLVVGLFDSLIDAARLNFLFWLVVLLSLVLPPINHATKPPKDRHV